MILYHEVSRDGAQHCSVQPDARARLCSCSFRYAFFYCLPQDAGGHALSLGVICRVRRTSKEGKKYDPSVDSSGVQCRDAFQTSGSFCTGYAIDLSKAVPYKYKVGRLAQPETHLSVPVIETGQAVRRCPYHPKTDHQSVLATPRSQPEGESPKP